MKILIVFFIIALSGCTSITHVENWDDSYYKQEIRNSHNVSELKKFLGENKIKMSDLAIADNKPSGNYSRILIDGSIKSLVTSETSIFFNTVASSLIFLELGAYSLNPQDLYKFPAQKNGKYYNTVFCTDLSHSNLSSNLDSLTLPITYMLTSTSKEDLIQLSTEKKYWDCDGYEFGDIIYKKSVNLTSTLDNAKIKYQFHNGENKLSDQDKVNLLTYDVVSKGVLARLSDLELLKALHDFFKIHNPQIQKQITEFKEERKLSVNPVAINLTPAEEKKAKKEQLKLEREDAILKAKQAKEEEIRRAIEEKTAIELERKKQQLPLDEFKIQCEQLGFKIGTEKFGKCVLDLNETKYK